MTRQISEIKSLPFYQIIGAPLLALVQGQTQAAQATAEFIERVGFGKPASAVSIDPESPDAAGETGQTSDLGQLRMARFSYKKRGIDGQVATFQAEVPILSLVPIPMIEIKEAELDFYIKVTDIQTETIQTSVSGTGTDLSAWLAQGRVGFRAAMGKMETTTAGEQRTDMQMKVHMKLGQSDIPVGLEHLFRIMDQSIRGSVVPASSASPPPQTDDQTGPE